MAKIEIAEYKSGKKVWGLSTPPKGYKKTIGANTAPIGFEWYNNGQSRFSGKRESVLVKED